MVAVTIASLVSFFAEEKKSIERGENHYRSDHVESFAYADGVIKGTVHASMKNKSYNVSQQHPTHRNRLAKRFAPDNVAICRDRLAGGLRPRILERSKLRHNFRIRINMK